MDKSGKTRPHRLAIIVTSTTTHDMTDRSLSVNAPVNGPSEPNTVNEVKSSTKFPSHEPVIRARPRVFARVVSLESLDNLRA